MSWPLQFTSMFARISATRSSGFTAFLQITTLSILNIFRCLCGCAPIAIKTSDINKSGRRGDCTCRVPTDLVKNVRFRVGKRHCRVLPTDLVKNVRFRVGKRHCRVRSIDLVKNVRFRVGKRHCRVRQKRRLHVPCPYRFGKKCQISGRETALPCPSYRFPGKCNEL